MNALLISALLMMSGQTAAQGVAPAFRGIDITAKNGLTIQEFRGIRYAEAPTGPLRWAVPLPYQPIGKVKATVWPPACPQGDGNVRWYRQVAAAFGQPPEVIAPTPSRSEDCLFLNIWSADSSGRSPVMVWIHGGSNKNGWSYEPNYLGRELASLGVVVVSVQYRLGVLGFLAHPDLSAESPVRSSGNYGVLDQLEALRWVKRNIAEFGGDTGNITLFGESAGAGNIGYLLMSPLAGGLFHKAILQSGGWSADLRRTLRDKEREGLQFASSLNATVAGLRQMSFVDLVAAAEESFDREYDDPSIDGWLLPESVPVTLTAGSFENRPLLVGTNDDEMRMYIEDESEETWNRLVDGHPQTQRLESWLGHLPLIERLDTLESAKAFHCPTRRLADGYARHGSPVFVYRFTRSRGENPLGAYHGAEIPYVFDTHDAWLPTDPVDRRLTRLIMEYWVRFANTGDPNHPGAARWQRWGEDELAMHFGLAAESAPLPGELCELLAEMP